jgi:peptide deformylase
MAVRKIIQPDNPILRQKARKVRDFDPKLHRLIDDMIETMLKAPGSGLAAPQVAVSERVIVIHYGDDENDDTLYEIINPEIVKASREMVDGIEGCLSIPGYAGLIERHESVIVRGQDRHGKEIRIKANDWLARIFQHEIDHLDGVLYTDKAKEVWQLGHMPPHVREMFDFDEDEEPLAEDATLTEEQDPPA